jgi:ABC-2 type transport system ATP-binding protein
MNREVLRLSRVKKNYGEKCVVNGISYCVNQGDILGLIGPNGAGKSTMIKMLAGIEDMTEGNVCFEGNLVNKGNLTYKRALGIVPQDIALYEDLSAYDNVAFFCSLYGFTKNEVKDRTKEALEFVGLWDRKKELPGKFSGGMKRRLNIACSIAHSPKLLIMDEPTVGIDPQSRNHIMESIKKLNERGTTVIYVSHYMEEIEELCSRVMIMDHGNILEDCSKQELKAKYQDSKHKSLEEIFLELTGTNLRDEE